MPSPAEMVRNAHRCRIKTTGWPWTRWIFQWTNLYPTKHYWATIRTLWTTDYHLCTREVLHSIYDHILWKILKMHSASQGYIDIFQELYAKSQRYIKIGSRAILYFKVETGVQQGHILKPFFFLLVMDYLMKNVMRLPHFGIVW